MTMTATLTNTITPPAICIEAESPNLMDPPRHSPSDSSKSDASSFDNFPIDSPPPTSDYQLERAESSRRIYRPPFRVRLPHIPPPPPMSQFIPQAKPNAAVDTRQPDHRIAPPSALPDSSKDGVNIDIWHMPFFWKGKLKIEDDTSLDVSSSIFDSPWHSESQEVEAVETAIKADQSYNLPRDHQEFDASLRSEEWPESGAAFPTQKVEIFFFLRRILEFRHSYQQPTAVCFVDFAASFDSVHRESLWRIMALDGVPAKIIAMIKAYYRSTTARVLVRNNLSQPFDADCLSTPPPICTRLASPTIQEPSRRSCNDSSESDSSYFGDIPIHYSPLSSNYPPDRSQSSIRDLHPPSRVRLPHIRPPCLHSSHRPTPMQQWTPGKRTTALLLPLRFQPHPRKVSMPFFWKGKLRIEDDTSLDVSSSIFDWSWRGESWETETAKTPVKADQGCCYRPQDLLEDDASLTSEEWPQSVAAFPYGDYPSSPTVHVEGQECMKTACVEKKVVGQATQELEAACGPDAAVVVLLLLLRGKPRGMMTPLPVASTPPPSFLPPSSFTFYVTLNLT
ncbi:hypothetical protein SprV_0100099600 [Sparganum proliferum]